VLFHKFILMAPRVIEKKADEHVWQTCKKLRAMVQDMVWNHCDLWIFKTVYDSRGSAPEMRLSKSNLNHRPFDNQIKGDWLQTKADGRRLVIVIWRLSTAK